MITHYKSWLEKEGTTQKVQRLEFMGFIKEDQKDKPLVYKDKKGNNYLCGLYRCLLPDNTQTQLKFRVEYDPDQGENSVGWNYSSVAEAIQDNIPDEITCTREMCLAGKVNTDYESTELLEVTKKRYNTILKLENILKDVSLKDLHILARLKLDYILSPSRVTSRECSEYRESNKGLDKELNKMVYG